MSDMERLYEIFRLEVMPPDDAGQIDEASAGARKRLAEEGLE